MIIDSKGKLFGKISIIDIIAIIIIIGVVAGVYLKFFGKSSEALADDCEFYYTMKVEAVRQNNIEAMKKSVSTEFELADDKIFSEMGTLTEVKSESAKSIINKADGNPVMAEIPDKYDAYLTFKVNGKSTDEAYYTPQLREISVGSVYGIKSKYCQFNGYIQKIWE